MSWNDSLLWKNRKVLAEYMNMKKNNFLRTGILLTLTVLVTLTTPLGVEAAPGFEDIAKGSQVAASENVVKYGMTPIYGDAVKDGTYTMPVESSSHFFNIVSADLMVNDGKMTAVLTMNSSAYPYVYMGTPEEAAKADLGDYIEDVITEDYWDTFTIPVEALNKPIDIAAFSHKKKMWYPRQILFDASELPEDAVDFDLPDYDLIDKAIDLYDEKNGTDSRGEKNADQDSSEAAAGEKAEPVDMEIADGTYSIEVSMTGGSGRASITSPTWLIVRDGKGYAKLLWSSTYYDYMIVGGEIYRNETTDGSNSTFTIPIADLDEPFKVIADTTAMGSGVEIEYMLTFYSNTIGSKNKVPQEGAKFVIMIALTIMLVGGILNHFVQKKRNRTDSKKGKSEN